MEELTADPLPRAFYAQPVVELARALIGCALTVDGVGGIIVETEAYHSGEPAAHSFAGETRRNAAMFGPSGRVYVYRSYGLHWCVNVVGGDERGAAVLIRALEPTMGLAAMAMRRSTGDPRRLCAGPGRVCQALGITGALDGAPIDAPPFALAARQAEPPIVAGPRIGISKATDLRWRFGLAGSRFLSRPFR